MPTRPIAWTDISAGLPRLELVMRSQASSAGRHDAHRDADQDRHPEQRRANAAVLPILGEPDRVERRGEHGVADHAQKQQRDHRSDEDDALQHRLRDEMIDDVDDDIGMAPEYLGHPEEHHDDQQQLDVLERAADRAPEQVVGQHVQHRNGDDREQRKLRRRAS